MSPSGSSDSMAFDGSSSDLARQLYYRAKANEQVGSLPLNSIPTGLQARLDSLQLDWSLLPGIAQRALLWDSGYAVSPTNDAIQIWTLGAHDMSSLALTSDEYEAAGCVFSNCTEPDNSTIHINNQCNGAQMNRAAKCVVQDFDDDDISYNTAMWAIGGSSSMVPKPRVAKHDWTVKVEGDVRYVVIAVHTLESEQDEPGYGSCPSGYGSVVFPCQTTANFTSDQERNTVVGSEWVSKWLVESYPEAKVEDSSGFDKLLLLPIVLGAVVVVGLIGVGFYCKKKRKQRARKEFQESTEAGQTPYQAPSGDKTFHQRDTNARPTLAVSECTMTTDAGADQTIAFPVEYGGDYVSGGSSTTLEILLTSEHLVGKRIPLEEVVFEQALSKGASGEVWVCAYAGQKVAVKRLLQAMDVKAEDVNEFAQEIELNASLQHPNVGAFIGVAWSSLNNLSMVLEYFPLGDLQRYLKRNADLLSWARDKIHMAVGVARALEYLHSRSPPIIHRDLKSKNILLTRQLEAKVIDFGVSRGRLDNTMTAGVGTPFWTAPEILEGKRYSEQADIYSFGVVLSELDTCKIPFHDCISSNGKKQKPFHILKEVMAGILRPSFSADCPPRIRRIGVACCQHDPARRPTAAQLVTTLQGEYLPKA